MTKAIKPRKKKGKSDAFVPLQLKTVEAKAAENVRYLPYAFLKMLQKIIDKPRFKLGFTYNHSLKAGLALLYICNFFLNSERISSSEER